MLSETREIELAPRDGTYADFESGSTTATSRSGFVVGIAIKQVSLIMFVPDEMSTGSLVDNRSKADLLDAVTRLLPKEDEVRVLNVGKVLQHRLAEFRDKAGADRCLVLDFRSFADQAIDQLARALLKSDEMGDAFVDLYADAVGLAIATRLLSRGDCCDPSQPKRNCGTLPKWRLKRVIEYIDGHLEEAITLADLAAVTGLTRMHFAAQFRVSTGIRPHEFLLRRRIEHAQELLLQSNLSIVDVALSVGFQTQAHFTTVFKRFVGNTPHQWRRYNYRETDGSREQHRRNSETQALSNPLRSETITQIRHPSSSPPRQQDRQVVGKAA